MARLLLCVAIGACTSTSHEGEGPGLGASGNGELEQQLDTSLPEMTGDRSAPRVDAGTESLEPIIQTPGADAGQDSAVTNLPIEEAVSEEDYYIRNERSEELRIVATTLFGGAQADLIQNSVPPHSDVHIFHALEGTGGHTLPSNFFGTFVVLVGDQVIYEGVRNDDWRSESLGLVLVIASDAPTESVDYSCEQASDCEIKDVGNCCGYYPRCVHVDSATPPVQCDDGIGSVCGWPDISHCECEDNTCRSMQGDSEI